MTILGFLLICWLSLLLVTAVIVFWLTDLARPDDEERAWRKIAKRFSSDYRDKGC